MNIVQSFPQVVPVGVRVAETSEDLNLITKPGCAAAIWRRQAKSGFQSWIDSVSPAKLPVARQVIDTGTVRQAVGQACITAETPACHERDHLIEDIAALAEMFAGLMRAPFLHLRLEQVTTNACRKFHIDRLSARLICTYRGTGTQYGISAGGSEPRRVFTVATGCPIVLRGTLWPENPASGLLHRSPPIQATGETRLVLVLDPVFRTKHDGPQSGNNHSETAAQAI